MAKLWQLWRVDPLTRRIAVSHEFPLSDIDGVGIDSSGRYHVRLKSTRIIMLTPKQAEVLCRTCRKPMPTLSEEDDELRIKMMDARRHLFD
jgi:hypothetical protein